MQRTHKIKAISFSLIVAALAGCGGSGGSSGSSSTAGYAPVIDRVSPQNQAERWYEDNNLGVAGALPLDFDSRMSDLDSWKTSREVMDVFYIRSASYQQHLKNNEAYLIELSALFNEEGIKLALDDTSATWAHAEEKNKDLSFTDSINSISYLKSLGFDVSYISLQSVLSKPLRDANFNELPYSMEERYADVLEFFKVVQTAFPEIKIGIIDALPAKVSISETESTYQTLVELLKNNGFKLDHIHSDVPVNYPTHNLNDLSFAKLVALEKFVKDDLNTRFGMFLTDSVGGKTDSNVFSENVLEGLESYIEAGGMADSYVLSAWYENPQYSTPDALEVSTATTFSVFRRIDQTLNFHGDFNPKSCIYDVQAVNSANDSDVMFPGYRGVGNIDAPLIRVGCFDESTLSDPMTGLYRCEVSIESFGTVGDSFVSDDVACKGQDSATDSDLLGYVYQNQNSDSSRGVVYSCKISGNYSVSSEVSECDDIGASEVLGYF